MTDWGAEEPGIEAQPIEVDDEPATVGAPADGQDGAGEPDLYYGSVDEFVREYLRSVYRRRIDGRHRCWAESRTPTRPPAP